MTKFLREEGCSVETLIEKKDKLPSRIEDKHIKEERSYSSRDNYKNEPNKRHKSESSRDSKNDSRRHSKEKKHRRSRSRSKTRSPVREKRDKNYDDYKKRHSYNHRS